MLVLMLHASQRKSVRDTCWLATVGGEGVAWGPEKQAFLAKEGSLSSRHTSRVGAPGVGFG